MSRLLLNALTETCYPLCATGYRRTRAHLLSWKAVLPAPVKEAAVYVSRDQAEAQVSPHSGSWLFLYENIPQLRYHNPGVKFLFEAHLEENSRINFTTADGATTSLETTNLRQRAIQTLVEDFIENHSHSNHEDHTPNNRLSAEQ